ncbi:hypothetical protein [Yersinia enterocolitica]
MQPIFTFDQDSAKTAGAGGASETGAYAGNIASAIFTSGRDSQSEAMELCLESDIGKINYLRINYKGRDGSPLKHGSALIHAIMGLNKIKQLNAVEVQGEQEIELHCPELEGKPVRRPGWLYLDALDAEERAQVFDGQKRLIGNEK